jgi:sterol desaturase/sphingolipid hydroxylase (fatty acid hydroxylase superfamily)
MDIIDQGWATLVRFAGYCWGNFAEFAHWTLDGGNRFFWVYVLSFVAIGAWLWRGLHHGGADGRGLRGLFGFLFPKAMYTHPSAIVDYKLVVTNRVLQPSGFLARTLLGSASIATVALVVQQGLVGLFGTGARVEWTTPMLVGYTIAIALVADFSTWLVHALHHRYPLLWEFHKVHHSAEVLTPLTVFRKHPVYNLVSRVLDLAIVGPFMGVVTYLFADTPASLTLFGANFVFSIFHVLGANLRHSHIWWSFGPVLSRVFISPAQHQIHHSKDPRHYDKNYGELFALWDWLFGTLYVPGRAPETLQFGLTGEDENIHPTLRAAYLVPFANCGKILRESARRLLPARERARFDKPR